MAEIKSAIEIALARTEGIEVDKDKIQAKEFKINGRKAALAFLDGRIDIKDLSKTVKNEKGDARKAFISGAAGSFMSIMKLPLDLNYKEEFLKAAEGIKTLSDSPKNIGQMFEQLVQFFDQYLQSREQMEKQLFAQFAPMLKKKEEAIYAQTGSRMSIDPLDDPEFQKIYSQNINALAKKYLEALNQAKQQLKQFLEIEE